MPPDLGHDSLDAAVGAYAAWCTRHAPERVALVGVAPYREAGVLREGFILTTSKGVGGQGQPVQEQDRARPMRRPFRGRRSIPRVEGLRQLTARLRQFAAERDWEQFHTPKNLAMALSVEVAELVEHFQWLTVEQSQHLDAATLEKVREEIGDVLIYLVRLGDKLGIDLVDAAFAKLQQNERKYPADKVRGKAKKYSEY